MNPTETLISDSVKIEKKILEPCLLQVDYTIPADKVSQSYDRMAKEFAKYVRMAGFRPGKVPVSMVKATHKKDIDDELLKELVSLSINKFIKEEKDTDILMYYFAKDKTPTLSPGADFAFSVRFNIAPEFDVPNYKGIVVQIEKREITEEQISSKIEHFRKTYGDYKDVEDKVQENDMLKVSYSSDAVLTENASKAVSRIVRSDFNYLWVDNNSYIPGISKIVIGAKTGDEIKFKAEFPQDYAEAVLAGKTINYDMKIIAVQRKSIVDSDEELCKKLGIASIDEMKVSIKKSFEYETKNKETFDKTTKAIEVLTKDLNFSVPPDMLNDETTDELNIIMNEKLEQIKDQAQVTKEVEENKDAILNEAKEKAIKRLRKFILFRKIGKLENINAEQDDVEKHIKSISQYYGYKTEDLKKRLMDSGNINRVIDDVIINKVTKFIADNVNVEYITKNV